MTRREFIRWCVRAAVVALAADAYFVEPQWIQGNEYDFSVGNNAATPVKLVQLSDLHLRAIDGALTDLAGKVNALNPDLICFTGDSIDSPKYLPLLDRYLGLLDKSVAKFAILGNWEYWGGVSIADLQSVYQRHGCRLLVNDGVAHTVNGKTLWITGVDDLIGGDANIKTATKNFGSNDFHLVLNHCPQYRDHMINRVREIPRMDLILSGHTHGGQINLLGFIPVLPPGSGKYIKGWYRDNFAPMYVSSGIGTSGVPFRLGCRPEMTVFNLMV